jgi:hypothetical protein
MPDYIRTVRVEDAVGAVLTHDITRIIPFAKLKFQHGMLRSLTFRPDTLAWNVSSRALTYLTTEERQY